MANRIDNRKDILLLLFYSPGRGDRVNEPVVGRTRLVKMVFLFQKEALPHFKNKTAISDEDFYQFFPWDFGPFSRDVYDDLTFFVLRDYVLQSDEADEDALPESAAEWEAWLSSSRSSSEEEIVSEYKEQPFRLTKKGEEFAAGLYNTLSPAQKKLLRDFKKRVVTAPLRALLKYVYENYEDMTAKSLSQ